MSDSPATVTTHHVFSADGTRIGYLRQGAGPGIVLVQGAMADATAYRDFASALSASFTVYSADRRGRGLSPKDYEAGHTIARDVEDIDAILAEAGARAVFGLSSGAVITLEAARTLDRIAAAIVYEPPFYADGIQEGRVKQLFAEIERGDMPSALIDSLLAAGTAPAVLRKAPRPVARLLARAVLAVDDRRRKPHTTFRSLLSGVRFDFHDVSSMQGRIPTFAALNKPLLLLSGTASPAFLREAIRTLHETAAGSEHIEFDGLGHDGPWNDGDPEKIASAVRKFLLA